MNTDKPMGNAMPDNHPPFGEVRRLECRDGHASATWWRAGGDQPFSPVDEPAAGVFIGSPCPVCGLELVEFHTLFDPRPPYHLEAYDAMTSAGHLPDEARQRANLPAEETGQEEL